MATCPKCGVSTRDEPGAMVVEEVFEAKELGTFSLSGQSLKFSAVTRTQLRCRRCGFKVLGVVDQGEFTARARDVAAALEAPATEEQA